MMVRIMVKMVILTNSAVETQWTAVTKNRVHQLYVLVAFFFSILFQKQEQAVQCSVYINCVCIIMILP